VIFMGEFSGLCQMCRIRPASHACRLCGRIVCDRDYDVKLGLCASCKRGKTLAK